MGLLKDIGVPGVIIIVLGALLIFGPNWGNLSVKCFQNSKKQSIMLEKKKRPRIKTKKSKGKARISVLFC